jgi:hypothetical protein
VSEPVKKQRPAGELSPTELVEHKQFDAVRTHTCTNCGKVFAIENLKCPECSTIAKGNEQGPFSNYSYEDAKANIENRVDSATVSPHIKTLRADSTRTSKTGFRQTPVANDQLTQIIEKTGGFLQGGSKRRRISQFESKLLPLLYAFKAAGIMFVAWSIIVAVCTGISSSILTGCCLWLESAWSWLCKVLSSLFVG